MSSPRSRPGPDAVHGPRADGRRSRSGAACLVLLVCYAVPLATFALLVRGASRVNASGQCTGIGFGCTLTPHDALVFAGTFIGVPALAVGLLLSAGTAGLLARNPDRSGPDIGLLAAWPAFLGFVALLVLAAGSA